MGYSQFTLSPWLSAERSPILKHYELDCHQLRDGCLQPCNCRSCPGGRVCLYTHYGGVKALFFCINLLVTDSIRWDKTILSFSFGEQYPNPMPPASMYLVVSLYLLTTTRSQTAVIIIIIHHHPDLHDNHHAHRNHSKSGVTFLQGASLQIKE